MIPIHIYPHCNHLMTDTQLTIKLLTNSLLAICFFLQKTSSPANGCLGYPQAVANFPNFYDLPHGVMWYSITSCLTQACFSGSALLLAAVPYWQQLFFCEWPAQPGLCPHHLATPNIYVLWKLSQHKSEQYFHEIKGLCIIIYIKIAVWHW